MNSWRTNLLFALFIFMIAAFFFSRAMLSMGVIAFAGISFLHNDIKTHLRTFFSSPVLWGMSLLFVLPLISGLWSEDKKEWLSVLRLKLPLLALPLAFAAPFSFSKKQWTIAGYIFIIAVTAGTLWSMSKYMVSIETINASYLKAKSIATPLNNDHVRFSWLVSAAILLCGLMGWQLRKQQRVVSISLLVCAAWFIFYLHILAARTGLFALYIIVLGTAAWLIVSKAKPKYGIAILFLLALLPLSAYWLLPSFQNRIKYIMYDYGYFKEMHYLPGGNDASRVISLRAGWNLLVANPLTGTGTGDISTEVRKWDAVHYPGMLSADMIYPSSEWLIYGLACGWAGVLLFTIIIFLPCFTKRKNNLAWLLLNLTAISGFLFDMGLEVQFGIFIYSFLVLWWWKWLDPQKQIPLTND